MIASTADILQFSLLLTPAEWRERAKQFFSYSVLSLNLAAAGVDQPTFNVDANAYFVVTHLTGSARLTSSAAIQADAQATIKIQDTGSGRNWFDRAADWENIVGTAELPGVLGAPYFLQPKATVEVTITSLAAAARDYRLNFMGFKVFNTNMGQ